MYIKEVVVYQRLVNLTVNHLLEVDQETLTSDSSFN